MAVKGAFVPGRWIHGESEKEISTRHPAGVYHVGAEKGNDDWPTAENDCTGEVHVGEEVQSQRWRLQYTPGDKNGNKGC